LDFHPRLTVISGVGRLEREGLISELVGSLTSSRAGVLAEVMADAGNRFAIFRPHGARGRVIDIDASADVSDRFADETGAIDLLSLAGLDERSAKRPLRLTSTDLTTITHHDQIIRRLAALDAPTLWGLAEQVQAAQAQLDEAAADSGSSPEDAAVVTACSILSMPVVTWLGLVGDIVPDWACEHRDEIEEASQRMTEVSSITANPLNVEDGDAAALAHALMARLEVVRTAGPGGESLPLILDDSLRGIDHNLKASLLELLLHSSNNQQLVFLTEDPDVADWARVEAITGELSILEPMAADETVASNDAP
jgi:hypothetical protein